MATTAIVGIVLFFFLHTPEVYAEQVQEQGYSKKAYVNLSLKGGYGQSESRSGLVDLQAEVQVRFSERFGAGLAIGYLSDSDNMHRSGSFTEAGAGMTAGMMGEMTGGFSGHSHQFRAIPITLSLYYTQPLNQKLDVFFFGGGGYYMGSYEDISKQEKKAFGPHAGLGVDFRITRRVVISAEGSYRFIRLKGFASDLHRGFREGMQGERHEEGFWHFHHNQQEWHFHEIHEDDFMLGDVAPFDIDLTGFSLRLGMKFYF